MSQSLRRRVPALLGSMALLAAAACSTSSSSGGSSSGTLRIAVGTDMDTLDPASQGSTGAMQRERQIVESLTTLDAKGQVQPLLATKWTSSADGLTWTFTLRSGVKFSDGEPFDAAAVKFSMDRLLSGKVTKARPDVMTVIKKTTVIDATHVQFTLSQPYAALPAALYQPMAGIVAPKSVTEFGNKYAQIVHPVGTGPFTFVEDVTGDHLTLAANKDYWGGAPKYSKEVWQVVPEAATRLAELRSGDADVIFDPPATEISSLKSDTSFNVAMMQLPQSMLLFLNQDSKTAPQLRNPLVRQALQYAINVNNIVNKLVAGAGTVLTGPLPSFDTGYCDAGNPTYNPAKAKALLAQAGASNLKLSMMAPNGRYLNDYTVGQAIAGDLRAVGITVNLAKPTDFPTYLQQIYPANGADGPDLSMIALGSIFLDGLHAEISYRTDHQPPNGYNGGRFSDPKFDTAYDQAALIQDPNQRSQAICNLSKMLVKDQSNVWLYAPLSPVISKASIKGLILLPSGMMDPSHATLNSSS